MGGLGDLSREVRGVRWLLLVAEGVLGGVASSGLEEMGACRHRKGRGGGTSLPRSRGSRQGAGDCQWGNRVVGEPGGGAQGRYGGLGSGERAEGGSAEKATRGGALAE